MFVHATGHENENLLVVTGCPEIGKTRLLRNLVTRVEAAFRSVAVAGFFVESVKVHGTRQGYDVVALDGTRCTFARPYAVAPNAVRVGNYHLNVGEFEATVLPGLRVDPDATLRGLYVVDGIGKLELTSRRFVTAFRKLWRSGHVVVATVATTIDKALLTDLSELSPTIVRLTEANWREASDDLFERVCIALERDCDAASDTELGSERPPAAPALDTRRKGRIDSDDDLQAMELPPLVSLRLDGDAVEGSTLFARLTVDGKACPTVPRSCALEWTRGHTVVASDTLQYGLTAADVGQTVSVTCTPLGAKGDPIFAGSVVASLVVAAAEGPPIHLRFLGVPVEDNVLQVVADSDVPLHAKLQWHRGDQLILSDSWAYPVTASDVGHRVGFTFTPMRASGQLLRDERITLQTDPVRKASVRRLRLLGAPVVGQRLTVEYHFDGPAETRWYRVDDSGSDELLTRATDNYTVRADDEDHFIKVEVRPTAAGHAPAEAVSRCRVQPAPGYGGSGRGVDLATLSTLTVTIVEGKGFPRLDQNGKNDPFAVAVLGSVRHQTRVQPNTDAPQWRETFTADLEAPGALPRALVVEVWEQDARSSDRIGSLRLPLDELPLRNGAGGGWFPLRTPQGAPGGSVYLQFAATFQSTSLPGSPVSSAGSAASLAAKQRRKEAPSRLVAVSVTAVRGQGIPRQDRPTVCVLGIGEDEQCSRPSPVAEWNLSLKFPTSSNAPPPTLRVEVRDAADDSILLGKATVPMATLPMSSQQTTYSQFFGLQDSKGNGAGKVLLNFEALFQRGDTAAPAPAPPALPPTVVAPSSPPASSPSPPPVVVPAPGPGPSRSQRPLPTTLNVVVLRAKGLPKMDAVGHSDPYVQLQLGKTPHRTTTKDNTATPEWNESYGFNLSPYASAGDVPPLEITVMDEDALGPGDKIGTASISIADLAFDPPATVRVEKAVPLTAAGGGSAGELFLAFEGYFRGYAR